MTPIPARLWITKVRTLLEWWTAPSRIYCPTRKDATTSTRSVIDPRLIQRMIGFTMASTTASIEPDSLSKPTSQNLSNPKTHLQHLRVDRSQESYESAALGVFSALERAESHLCNKSSAGPYFFGACITETDVRLFTTVIRFDPVYAQHFKVNLKDIRTGFPALHRWMRWMYWKEPAFKDTTHFDHIKWNYTKSHKHINPTGITPLGPIPHISPLDEAVEFGDSSNPDLEVIL